MPSVLTSADNERKIHPAWGTGGAGSLRLTEGFGLAAPMLPSSHSCEGHGQCLVVVAGQGEHAEGILWLHGKARRGKGSTHTPCALSASAKGNSGSKGHYSHSHVPIHVCEVRIVAQSWDLSLVHEPCWGTAVVVAWIPRRVQRPLLASARWYQRAR